MSDGDPLPEEIVLSAPEARIGYLAVVAALDKLDPGEAKDLCLQAQRIA